MKARERWAPRIVIPFARSRQTNPRATRAHHHSNPVAGVARARGKSTRPHHGSTALLVYVYIYTSREREPPSPVAFHPPTFFLPAAAAANAPDLHNYYFLFAPRLHSLRLFRAKFPCQDGTQGEIQLGVGRHCDFGSRRTT